MDVRRDRFGLQLVKFLQDVSESHFVAFDLEFSGLGSRNRDRSSKPNLGEYYSDLRIAVQQYQVLQIGLTLVKLDDTQGKYIAKPYNYNISPLPDLRERQFKRTWSMNSGAISFLQRQGFDFGRWMTHGIPYLSRQEEQTARTNMTAEAKRDDMVLKSEDQPLVKHIRKTIEEWQAQPKEKQESYVNIPHDSPPGLPSDLNRYQMRLTHQVVQNEYPGLSTRGMTGFVQITNPGSEQQASQKQLEAEQREKDLNHAIGFRWIMEAIAGKDVSAIPEGYLHPVLSQEGPATAGDSPARAFVTELAQKLQQRRRIIIGHNCLTDLMYLYKMTIGDLPEDLETFIDKLHELFPAVVDTKYLATCHSEKYGRSTLGDVELDLQAVTIPRISTPPQFDRYVQNAYYHEAGFDSYITAIVATKLSAKLYKDGSARKKDRDREEQQIAKVAASSPPEFGLEEGYVTAAESVTSQSSAQTDQDDAPQKDSSISNASTSPSFSPSAAPEPSNSGHSESPEVVAVKQHKHAPVPVSILAHETSVEQVRNAFASTSIWDNLDQSGEARMPGEESPSSDKDDGWSWPSLTGRKKDKAPKDMDVLVKNGQMMPRWHEEAAFWERYGNRLQVNGTQEGVLRLTD